MHERLFNPARTIALAALVSVACGCSLDLQALLASSAGTPSKSISVEAQDLAAKALGLTPDELTEVETQGILAKNSSKFSGTVTVPDGILAKNSSKYRVQEYSEVPLPNAYVVLASPAEGVYSVRGKVAAVKTDSLGRFDFNDIQVPVGLEVLLMVKLENTFQDFVTYTVSEIGDNHIDLDLPSTYATRYLMHQTIGKGKILAGMDRSKFRAVRELTRALLSREDLVWSPDSLKLGREADLTASYYSAMKARSPGLLDAWRDLLGFEPEPAVATTGPMQTEVGEIERHPGTF